MKLPIVEPTPEQLRAAFARLSQLHMRVWPATVEDALADDAFRPLVRGMAVSMARAALARGQVERGAPKPPHPAKPQRPRLRGPTYDARRAAANDRLDDEEE